MVMDNHKPRMSQNRRNTKRSSYFETLNSVTSQLDFMREDLSVSHAFQFTPMSPLDLGTNQQVQSADLLCGTQHHQAQPLQQVRGTPAGYDSLPTKKVTVTNTPTDSSSKLYADVFKFPPPPLTQQVHETLPEMTMRSRIVHSKLVWYLPRIKRPAAVHYLQGQPTGECKIQTLMSKLAFFLNSAYLDQVNRVLVKYRDQNFVEVNLAKTNEIVIDLRKVTI